jgi:hypothetical protein
MVRRTPLVQVLPPLLTLLCAYLASAQDLNKPPFPEWRDSTVLRVLTDSPWSKRVNVPLQWTRRDEQPITYKDVPGADRSPARTPGAPVGGSPIGGIGVPRSKLPSEASLIIRWASALPVRQAVALYKQRDAKLEPSKINELVGVPSPDYIVEIRGVPAEIAHSGAESVELIARQGSLLTTRTGRTIRPSRATVSIQGTTLTIQVHFPRADPLRKEEHSVEFSGNFQIFEIKQTFRLAAMTYLGHLEL